MGKSELGTADLSVTDLSDRHPWTLPCAALIAPAKQPFAAWGKPQKLWDLPPLQ